MKIDYKKICTLFVLLLVSCLVLNNVEAAITAADGKLTTNASIGDKITGTIMDVFEFIAKANTPSMLATTAATITALAVALFLVLNLVLAGATQNFAMAFPDTIVFNRYPFFDANFINPHESSLIYNFGDIFKNLFASLQAIAIAVFIIAAMVMGIKLAFSTIAAKKAQYKEYALKWVTGFLILICLKWLLAGIFLINETVVSKLYDIASSSEFKIPVYITESFRGWFGKAIDVIVKGVSQLTGWDFALHIAGYMGIAVANICKALGGDLIASIVAFVLMGQTITIVGHYLKRVFMCALFGIMGPLVVAVDTINSVLGKQSKIFGTWLQNITITVFMQTIHAFYMVALFQILSSLYKKAYAAVNPMPIVQVDIVTIFLTTGLVKLEKVFKSMFGLGDSLAGSLGDGAKGMVKAMAAVKGLKAGLDAVNDNKKKAAAASNKVKAYDKKIAELSGKGGNTSNTTIVNNNGNSGGSGEGSGSAGSGAGGNSGGGSGGAPKSTGNFLDDVLNEYNSGANMTDDEKLEMLHKARKEARAEEFSARIATKLGPANMIAGLGLGLGMNDDISESLFKGGYMAQGLDFITEKGSYHFAKSRLGGSGSTSGGSSGGSTSGGFSGGSSGGSRTVERVVEKTTEKTTDKMTAKEAIASGLYQINPIGGIMQLNKQFAAIGDEFADVLKKKIKEVDKDIDNS